MTEKTKPEKPAEPTIEERIGALATATDARLAGVESLVERLSGLVTQAVQQPQMVMQHNPDAPKPGPHGWPADTRAQSGRPLPTGDAQLDAVVAILDYHVHAYRDRTSAAALAQDLITKAGVR